MAAQTQTMQVYESIKTKIDKGEYSPAESLREAALSTEYGVSRNTIKKALLMLENDGYVTIETNKGAHVRSYSKAEVLEFLQLRENLEGFIAGLSAACISEKDLNSLEKILKSMEQKHAENDLLGYSELNQRFHALIYSVCPNRMGVDILVKLKNQMKKYNSKSVLIPGRADNSLKEHSDIYHALKKHDSETARTLMETHIRHVRDTYEHYYEILF